jgi:predicted GNAT family acetyltransferase
MREQAFFFRHERRTQMTSAVSYNEANKRYEMDVNGQTVYADVRRRDDTLFIDYVEAPPALRGKGAAGKFMKELMETIRQENVRVVPLCSYAAVWVSRHPEYQDLQG